MSEPEDTGGTVWDDPNRQAVGLDPAWVEGTGGSSEGEATPHAATKAELLEQAHELSLDVTEQNTKAEIKAAIEEATGT
jgi:arginase family enzyme